MAGVVPEFERIYRLLDLPETADAKAVRESLAQRLKQLEKQKTGAGSKPERRMADRALQDTLAAQDDAVRLAAALEVSAFLAEARTAIGERKGARARRELNYAAEAAQKAGLERLGRAIAEVEDEFADAGLKRDQALETEVDDLAERLAACQAEIEAGAAAAPLSPPPAELVRRLQEVEHRLAAIALKTKGQRGSGVGEQVGALQAQAQACTARLNEWRAAGEAHAARLRQIGDERARFEAATSPEAVEALTDEALAQCAAGVAALMDGIAAEANDEQLAREHSALLVVRQRLERERERRDVLAVIASLETAAAAGGFSEAFEQQLGEVEKGVERLRVADAAPRLAALRAALEVWKHPPPPPPPEPETTTPEPEPEPPPPPPAPPPPPEPAPADRFTLVGPEGERCHVICVDRAQFGRSKASDVIVRAYHPADVNEERRVSGSISRVHFVIERQHDDVLLADGGPTPEGTWRGSANGTFDGENRPIDRVQLFRSGLASFGIVRDARPVAPPQWDVQLQMRANLPPHLAAIRDALPLAPDALHLRRTDGLCEDVLFVWRAANLQELGLSDTPACLVRHRGGFLLWQDDRLVGVEIGFRVGHTWSVASLGSLTFRA